MSQTEAQRQLFAAYPWLASPAGPSIGLIGGVGPMAGVDLARKLCEEAGGGPDQNHPGVILLSLPSFVPDRTAFLRGGVETNPGIAIGQLACSLADLGCRAVAVACNTAHAPPIWHEVVATLDRHPRPPTLLHIAEEVGRHLRSGHPELERIGVLSTTGTWQSGLYPEILARLGVSAVVPDEVRQASLVQRAIYDPRFGLKARQPTARRARQLLDQALQQLADEGAQAVILACTELPLAFGRAHWKGLPLIDPNRVLARALLRASTGAPHNPGLAR